MTVPTYELEIVDANPVHTLEVQVDEETTHVLEVAAVVSVPGPPGGDGSDGAPGTDGAPGVDGREVEFQTAAGFVQWRYVGEVTWTNLIALSAITGAPGQDGAPGTDGPPGDDGREVEFQKSATHVQWRYVGDPTWTNLVALVDITGPEGAPGDPASNIVTSVNGDVGDVVLTQDDIADGTTAKQYTGTEKTKLAGIASGATANATDAALRDRSTHTGSQASTTISDFTEAVQDAVASLLASGTNVTLTYDDVNNTLVVDAAGGDAEYMRDTIGAALVGVGNISVVVNDAGDTITISTTATANATDAALRDRTTHTGTQSADTITDGATNKVFTAADETKLDGVATGATANATNAELRDRATHTGTQAASTITGLATVATTGAYADLTGSPAIPDSPDDIGAATAVHTHPTSDIVALTEAIQDVVAGMVVQGTNITVTYDDTAGTLTIDAAGGGGGLDTEAVQDAVAAMFDVNTEVVYNDTTGKLTIDFPTGGGGTEVAVERVRLALSGGNQTLNNAAFTTMSWGTELIDSANWHDVLNPSRITVAQTGTYEFETNVHFLNDAGGTNQKTLRIIKNGSDANILASESIVNAQNSVSLNVSTGPVELVAGDYIEVRAYAGAAGYAALDDDGLTWFAGKRVAASSITPAIRTINAQTGTSYTLVSSDLGGLVTMTNSSPSTLIVPANATVAFPVGCVVEGVQLGTGQVTITPASGVTVLATPGAKVAAQYGMFALLKIAADTWVLSGRLSA